MTDKLKKLLEKQEWRAFCCTGCPLEGKRDFCDGDGDLNMKALKKLENFCNLKIKKIVPQTVECFLAFDISVGELNEYEFNQFRIEIANNEIGGCYCLFNNKKVFIETNGKIKNWEQGLFDTIEQQFAELFKTQIKIQNKQEQEVYAKQRKEKQELYLRGIK